MKLKHLIIIVLFFLGCKKNVSHFENSKSEIDSTYYFIQKSKNDSLPFDLKSFYLDKAYNKILNENSEVSRKLLSEIVLEFYNSNQKNKFKEASDKLLKKSLIVKDSSNMAMSYRCIGTFYKENEVLDTAFYYFTKAEKIYQKLNDELVLANVLLNKGIVQYKIGDYLGAELSLTKSNSIFKNSDRKDKYYGVLNQLGLVYTELNEYDKAIFFHSKALDVVRKYNLLNKEHPKGVCYNNIGFLYLKQKKYRDAIKNFELGLNDKNIIDDDPELYMLLINNLAYSKFKIHDYTNLPNMFFESLKLSNESKLYSNSIYSLIHLSEFYYEKKDFKKSLAYANEANRLSKITKIPTDILSSLKQLSIVDKTNSTKFSNLYIKLSDSLQIVERSSKDRFARIAFETDEIIKEKDKLEEQNRTLLYVSLVVGIILTLLFILRAQRARTRELIYKQAQQKANEEIFNLMMSQQNVIDESRKEEKHRIARDLHDGVLGRMFGVRLNLDSLNYRNDAESTEKRHQYINELKDIEQDIREISHDLNREKQALINNFISIINKLLEEQSHLFSTNLKYYIDDKIIWDKINNTSKINLYRILQESLQNINKYAEAKHIFVELKKENDNIVLNIEDDGLGFDVTKKSKGIGVQNMISRTDECHGIIDITSKKGHGTKISIKIPIEINTTNII